MVVSTHKKNYMKGYNQKPEVKARKAEYMRKFRANADREAAERLVNSLLEQGFEDWAFDVAQERAPHMLITTKNRVRKRK
uniref:Regulatory protein RecX n=1 Tax=uncultured marine group II/III euryarchaeote KM3_37_C11 TaxID=1456442 RepID=A0A075H082_9EURY|nr:hypothetical protein [uncultured marine group II/III euryarchaeote KM3_37_C11]